MEARTLTITLQPDWKAALRASAQVAFKADSYQGERLNFESAGAFFSHLTERRWALIHALQGAGEVLIAGPGQAKLEFLTYLAKHDKILSRKVVGIETMDRATDGQIVAYARNYFARSDRMRPRIG